jgi:alanyl-tRNA synthetase
LFFLYTSYGLPLEISKELLKENGLIWKEESQRIFDELFRKHQEISKG